MTFWYRSGKPVVGGVHLDLFLIKRDKLVEDMKVGGNLDGSVHEMIEYTMLKKARK